MNPLGSPSVCSKRLPLLVGTFACRIKSPYNVMLPSGCVPP